MPQNWPVRVRVILITNASYTSLIKVTSSVTYTEVTFSLIVLASQRSLSIKVEFDCYGKRRHLLFFVVGKRKLDLSKIFLPETK